MLDITKLIMTYVVQFNETQLANAWLSFRTLDEEVRRKKLMVVRHELLSDLSSMWNAASFFNSEHESLGPIPAPHQREYVSNIESLATIVRSSIDSLQDHCASGEKDEIVMGGIQKSSNDLVKRMKDLAVYLPSKERVLEFGEVSDIRKDALSSIDANSAHVFYTFNLMFSDNFRRDVYDLPEDIKLYWVVNHTTGEESVFYMDKPSSIARVQTNVDYFGNVVLPLIKNIYHHASNPENDVNERRKKKDFSILLAVGSDRPENERGEITFIVVDQGFGIRPEVRDKIFERGYSTKADVDSGIGLWVAKEFVESNGGRIWCETELGQYTLFRFTVPFSRREGNIYIQ